MRILNLIQEIGGLFGRDEKGILQSHAAASLIGLETHSRKQIEIVEPSHLSFEPSGRRLFISGMDGQTHAWDAHTDRLETLNQIGRSLFAFRADGTVLQLAGDQTEPTTLTLWDTTKSQMVRKFASPFDKSFKITALTITPDGSYVGASFRLAEGSGRIVVWNAAHRPDRATGHLRPRHRPGNDA